MTKEKARARFRFYLITDRKLVPDLPVAVAEALSVMPKGLAAVQLREKDLSARELLALARKLLPICRAAQTALLVNDRLDVAMAAELDGVHLSSNSVHVEDARRLLGPDRLVGVSCHALAELDRCSGADFALFGPVFETPSKLGLVSAAGLDALAQASVRGKVPVFGVGGIDALSVGQIVAAGAHGAAVIRAWLGGDQSSTARLVSALREGLGASTEF